eukprot:364953-Chlamydomonas_euryale.AAC.9
MSGATWHLNVDELRTCSRATWSPDKGHYASNASVGFSLGSLHDLHDQSMQRALHDTSVRIQLLPAHFHPVPPRNLVNLHA